MCESLLAHKANGGAVWDISGKVKVEIGNVSFFVLSHRCRFLLCHTDHTLMKISKDVLDERSELT